MSSDSMLVFHEAEASEMANLFSQKATLVRDFIPDVNSASSRRSMIGQASLARHSQKR